MLDTILYSLSALSFAAASRPDLFPKVRMEFLGAAFFVATYIPI